MIDDPQLDAILRTYRVPAPLVDATDRVLKAAAPILARYVARPDWVRVRRAILVTLLVLPSVLAFDAVLLQGLYRLLATVLPHGLSLVLTVQYALGLFILFGGAFVLIPVVAGHAAPLWEDPNV